MALGGWVGGIVARTGISEPGVLIVPKGQETGPWAQHEQGKKGTWTLKELHIMKSQTEGTSAYWEREAVGKLVCQCGVSPEWLWGQLALPGSGFELMSPGGPGIPKERKVYILLLASTNTKPIWRHIFSPGHMWDNGSLPTEDDLTAQDCKHPSKKHAPGAGVSQCPTAGRIQRQRPSDSRIIR